jgi:hypothetical protein
MKFIATVLLTAFLSYVGGLYLDWWIIAIVAFAVAMVLQQKPLHAFLSGFLALFLLWGTLAFVKDAANQHLLSAKISELLFKSPSHWLLIFVTALVGGLTAGFAALTASFTRKKKA